MQHSVLSDRVWLKEGFRYKHLHKSEFLPYTRCTTGAPDGERTMLALRAGKGKSKKAKPMTSAQRAVADRLASKAKRVVGYPSRAI